MWTGRIRVCWGQDGGMERLDEEEMEMEADRRNVEGSVAMREIVARGGRT